MEFIDLAAQQARIRPELDRRISAVLNHHKYIMGPEVGELESALSAFSGAKHVVTCASGTDALLLALMAMEVKPGDVVFCPSFTFAATAEVMPMLGAIPYFVDIDAETFNIDPESLERSISAARDEGLRAVGVVAVDLFGQPADYDRLESIIRGAGLWLIADAAQSFGARYRSRRTGTIGDIATTSFFPAKPLGCYGDGGAVFTDSAEAADLMRSLRVHGKGDHKYDNVRIGMCSRLDTIQAAILLAKLSVYEQEIALRQEVADRYFEFLSPLADHVTAPKIQRDVESVWAQYTLKLSAKIHRDDFVAALAAKGVPTAVYYPKPLHEQIAYESFFRDPSGLQVSTDISKVVVSLPMNPDLDPAVQQKVCEAIRTSVVPQGSDT